MKRFLVSMLIFTALSGISFLSAQVVYQHVSSTSIYSFLDEMAGEGLIELNSVVKPYSRQFITGKLLEIQKQHIILNRRQLNDLNFFLKDFNKEIMPDKHFDRRFDLFYYKDSLFTFSLNPVLGIEYWYNKNGSAFHRWNGAEVFSYVGPHLGVYASLRDNHDDARLSDTNYLDTRPGVVYKSGMDYSEMRGGFTWSWKWGVIGLVKDHVQWGNFYHYPSIFSDKAPSFAQIKLNIHPAKWFEFNYIHGWLVSAVVDSNRSYHYTNSYGSGYREVFHKKFVAANMFTFKPFRAFYASIGNSIVYSDIEAHPAFLVPVFLYKSVDHTLINGGKNDLGQNSHFFFDISSRQISHVHLYATIFMDDISFSRFWENKHFDYYSLNAGFRLSNIIANTALTAEYFKSYPLVYKHDMLTTTYESNNYVMGHYLQDNSRGLYAELLYKPISGLDISASMNQAWHGKDHESLGTNRVEVTRLFMDSLTWRQQIYELKVGYQVMNDVFIRASCSWSNTTGEEEKYTAELFRGELVNFYFSLNYGF